MYRVEGLVLMFFNETWLKQLRDQLPTSADNGALPALAAIDRQHAGHEATD